MIDKIRTKHGVVLLIKLLACIFSVVFILNKLKVDDFSSPYFIIDIVCSIAILAVLFYALIKAEEGFSALKQNKDKYVWIYAIIFSGYCMSFFNPMDKLNTAIKHFSRVIGNGVVAGYDVSRVISNFTLWFLLFACIAFVSVLFISLIRSREYTEEQEKAWAFLDDFVIVAGINLVLKAITFFKNGASDTPTFYYSTYIIGLVATFVFLYIIWNLWKNVSFEKYVSLFLILFSIAFPVAVLINEPWDNGILLLGVQSAFLLMGVLIIKFGGRIKHLINDWSPVIFTGTIIASFLPIALSFYIELVNIIVGRGVFITHLRKYYIISLALILFTGLALFVVIKNWKKPLFDEKVIAFPVLVIGIAALSVQVPLTSTYTADIFEGANYGILISDFLNFGDVPIVGHYGGHMMTRVWEGILYGILNNDPLGAAFSPYTSYLTIFIAVLFFFLLKNIWGDKIAFFSAILLPFYSSISTFAMGFLIILAVVSFIKKNSYGRAFLIWIACAWCSLYRLDTGYAFDFACLVGLACYIIHEKRWDAIKKLAITLFGTLAVLGGCWCVLCICAGVNPVSRLFEFLLISASNQTWAYSDIGDTGKLMYFWCYIILPISTETALIYAMFSKRLKEKAGTVCWCILIILGSAYFVNFARGLTRHSLRETNFSIVIWTAYLFLSLFIASLKNKKLFMPVFFAFVLIQQVFAGGNNFTQVSLADTAGSRISKDIDSWDNDYWKDLSKKGKKVDRVVINQELIDQVEPLEVIVDLLLDDNETYVDFMNRTFAYSYLQRENPVYVSQSPLQLSGEYTQEQFVDEISKNKELKPIVIVPFFNNNRRASSALDGVSNTVRYYKVAEYLWQNYFPLCRNGEYAVWCLPDRYEDFASLLDVWNVECIDDFEESDIEYDTHNMSIISDEEGITLAFTGKDPYIRNLEKYLSLDDHSGEKVLLQIEYQTDVKGTLQLFYTENEGESFSENKSLSCDITTNGGIAEFNVPVTEYTKIRLDIPELSQVTISSLKVASEIEPISYGYDWFTTRNEDAEYIDTGTSLHVYNLKQLAQIWGEMDEKEAVNNPVVAGVGKIKGVHRIASTQSIDKANGNYLHLQINYNAEQDEDSSKSEPDRADATVRMGIMQGDTFIEKYRYNFSIESGLHDYLIRISNDYFWYSEDIDTLLLDSEEDIQITQISVLAGD